jgi:hypothetical protein
VHIIFAAIIGSQPFTSIWDRERLVRRRDLRDLDLSQRKIKFVGKIARRVIDEYALAAPRLAFLAQITT